MGMFFKAIATLFYFELCEHCLGFGCWAELQIIRNSTTRDKDSSQMLVIGQIVCVRQGNSR